MGQPIGRRKLLRGLGSAFWLRRLSDAAEADLRIAGRPVELQIRAISAHTIRITALPNQNGETVPLPVDGALVEPLTGRRPIRLRTITAARTIHFGSIQVAISPEPLGFTIAAQGGPIQRLRISRDTGIVSFQTGNAPLLGLGEGGPQFDRRGSTDRMRSGQGGYQLRTHGGRVPVPWIIGTSGWALFFHQPSGAFDFSGSESSFQPASLAAALPMDLFVVVSRDPATIMSEYTRLTGFAELPPLWSFGYQQSHRTLSSREEILAEARIFREKRLPCDALIFLGTGFTPSGWNTNNGEWTFNQKTFPDPKAMFDALHAEHFKVVLHAVIRARAMRGSVRDACDPAHPPLLPADAPFTAEEQPACYWNLHRPTFALGVDGWWPDEGDPLDGPSRLARNRMYWEAPQLDRPNERPFALHRNGYPGMQRYGSFLWSGDVYSTWETLRTHIPIAINTGISGIPYWGTDIGGFVPTPEFTSELYVRWFQFGAFCTLFRAHGRTWKLRLPWGWNTGELGPVEIANYSGAGLPQPSDLHHGEVEPICRKYLELRYRLLPYLYSAVRECTQTGLPVMRALWLHYPDDPVAAARGDEYLWGRDLLVAPVVEKGATSRELYLPRGVWYDFWTGERLEGRREVTRPVDLETMPIYVRAGAILPLGPVKQYVDEPVGEPLEITVYPGGDGALLLYEDDGRSFNYRKGEWMGIQLKWNGRRRTLTLRLAPGSRMLSPGRRVLIVKLEQTARRVTFEGGSVDLDL
jgi:alpha-glucosidase/alpha-D-xyloside xylohydrolase